MALGRMIYRKFKFPANPEVTGFECDRAYVRHKYPELAGNELEDFGPNAVLITGSGEFFGSNAYTNWNKLLVEFNKNGVGKIYHPIFKTVTRGLMTKLKADLEPRDNYVRYSFEIIADTKPESKSGAVVVDITSKSTGKTISDAMIGDTVKFTGSVHYTSSYSSAKGYNCKPGMAKITSINKSGAHPYHLIHTNGGGSTVYGWVNTVDMDGVMDIKRDTSNKVVHTVVGGECLSVICANYSKKYGVNISWKSVAEYNKLKNPGSIDVGQKITIVW